MTRAKMESLPTYENFVSQMNTTFHAGGDNGDVPLELAEISNRKLTDRQEEFSITLRGPGDRLLGQGTRRFHHPQLGDFDLFIVPIRSDRDGCYYQAVFNFFKNA